MVHRINTMDMKLGIGIDWYDVLDWCDVLDLSSVQLQHQLIRDGRASTDIVHEEDVDPSIDNKYQDINFIQRNTQVSYKKFDPSIGNVYLEDDIMGLKDELQYMNFGKCSVTSIVEVLGVVKWYIIPAAQGLL